MRLTAIYKAFDELHVLFQQGMSNTEFDVRSRSIAFTEWLFIVSVSSSIRRWHLEGDATAMREWSKALCARCQRLSNHRGLIGTLVGPSQESSGRRVNGVSSTDSVMDFLCVQAALQQTAACFLIGFMSSNISCLYLNAKFIHKILIFV